MEEKKTHSEFEQTVENKKSVFEKNSSIEISMSAILI